MSKNKFGTRNHRQKNEGFKFSIDVVIAVSADQVNQGWKQSNKVWLKGSVNHPRQILRVSGWGGQHRGRMHPVTGSPHSFLFCLFWSFPVPASHRGKLPRISHFYHPRLPLHPMLSVLWSSAFKSQRSQANADVGIGGASSHFLERFQECFWGSASRGLFLLRACDNDKDVRDPAAEMTSILSSCYSVPTVSARKTRRWHWHLHSAHVSVGVLRETLLPFFSRNSHQTSAKPLAANEGVF